MEGVMDDSDPRTPVGGWIAVNVSAEWNSTTHRSEFVRASTSSQFSDIEETFMIPSPVIVNSIDLFPGGAPVTETQWNLVVPPAAVQLLKDGLHILISSPSTTPESGTGTASSQGLSSGAISSIYIAVTLAIADPSWMPPYLPASMMTTLSQSATIPDSDWSQFGFTDSSGANSQSALTLHIMNGAGEASTSDSEMALPYRKCA
uniref:Uncharacterized protein n=1 Tax=Moniliophthora roreri TaxID=221103 RepID=A0A0W0FAE0_MONRR